MNTYYHDGLICDVEPIKFADKDYPIEKIKKGEIRQLFCNTHQVKFWSCGWEVGFHYGEKSEFYTKRQLYMKEYNKKYYKNR